MSQPKQVTEMGHWAVYVQVNDGTGRVWVCQPGCLGVERACHPDWGWKFSVSPKKAWWFGKAERGVSEAVMCATDEVLRRIQQEREDAAAVAIASEVAEEIGGMVRERLEPHR